MPQCKHYDICGRDGSESIEADLCILHSKNPDKDKQAFDEALDTHRSKRGDNFSYFVFPREIDFSDATFKKADFGRATFSDVAIFDGATFSQEAIFGRAKLLGRVFFTARQEKNGLTVPIFSNTQVDFRAVILDPLDGLILRDADLQLCEFLDTDLRKAEMTGALWPKIGKRGRVGVYDEEISEKRESYPWSRLERLYRELKQNYEDRRDYERAGDFHYGEKEMRRKNPQTPRSLRFFLTLYWAVSGYGERYLRPLVWAAVLFVFATILYLWLGLEGIWTGGRKAMLSMARVGDWLQAAHFSFRSMVFFKPEEVATPVSYSRVIHTVQSLLGPLFLGLFALAVRQRLKR